MAGNWNRRINLGKAAIRFTDAREDTGGFIQIFTENDPAFRCHAAIAPIMEPTTRATLVLLRMICNCKKCREQFAAGMHSAKVPRSKMNARRHAPCPTGDGKSPK